ncbi:MAG: hypothetical protein JNM43_27220 [Planctomycetaceae bacterium]|nr:hypothetical protein [Planctomycetaceae bacterium]
MLRKTEPVHQVLCRMSGAALGVALLISPVSADEPLTGRARLKGLAPDAVFEQSAEAAASDVRQTAAESVETADIVIERVYEETEIETDRPDYSRVERVESEYTRRLNSVLDGADNFTSFESAGEWWSRRQARTTARGKALPRVREYVSGLMYEEMPQPDVDFYDAGPISISATPIQKVSAQEAAPADDESGLKASRRLKTDIRSIQPSLSYALKNIDKSQLPEDYDDVLDRGQYVARTPTPAVLQWAPSNFWHYPLYFEDPALERYGHTYSPLVQPFASTGRFATQLVGLPYQMALHPVCEKQYALGYYRPGECAPKKMYQIPFNEEATVVQAAAVAGLILIIP